MESGEKPKTDSGHSRWTGGGDKKEGNLLRRLVLGGPKSRGSLYAQSLRSLYRHLKGVQRRVPATWSPQHLTRKASTSKRLRLWEPCGEMHKGRGGARSLPPSPRVHGQSRPLDDLLRHQVQPIHAPSVTDNQP